MDIEFPRFNKEEMENYVNHGVIRSERVMIKLLYLILMALVGIGQQLNEGN